MTLAHSSVWECEASYCGLQFALPQLEEAQLHAAYTNLYYPDAEGRRAAHAHYEGKHTAERNYPKLMKIDRQVLG